MANAIVPAAGDVVWEWAIPADLQVAGMWHAWYNTDDAGADGRPSLTIQQCQQGKVRLEYYDRFVFVLDNESWRVWVELPNGATPREAMPYLTGPVWAFLLWMRGIVCLHASAIDIGGKAILVSGPSGGGKSTTAAALTRLGYAALCDDVVAIGENAGEFFAHPAYPGLRLWPQSVAALFGTPDALPCMSHGWDKRILQLVPGKAFCAEPLPIAGVYLLAGREDDDAPRIEQTRGHEALVQLLANAFLSYLPDQAKRVREFRLFSALIGRVRLRRVIAHNDVQHIERMCRLVVADVLGEEK